MNVSGALVISNAAAEASCVAEALTQLTAFWIANAPENQDAARQRAESHLAACAALMGFELVKRETAQAVPTCDRRAYDPFAHIPVTRSVPMSAVPDEEKMWGRT